MTLRVLAIFVVTVVLSFTFITDVRAQQQTIFSSFGTLGVQAGMQEFGDIWIGYAGLFADLGPERGAQIRLAVKSGLFNSIVLTQLQTLMILNIGTARQRFFAGGGLSIPIVIGELDEDLPIQFIALFGLRAPPVSSLVATIEGGLVIPINFDSSPKIYWGFGVSIPI
jgi:hypothetical protein